MVSINESEHTLQRSVAQYLDAVLTKDVLWSGIDHAQGGHDKTAIIRQAKLKGRGIKKGWPDVVLYWSFPRIWSGLGLIHHDTICRVGHIELKSAKGRMKPEQIEFADRCQALGHRHAVVRSIEDLRRVLREWAVPTRESR